MAGKPWLMFGMQPGGEDNFGGPILYILSSEKRIPITRERAMMMAAFEMVRVFLSAAQELKNGRHTREKSEAQSERNTEAI
jgi:hypothetical protein